MALLLFLVSVFIISFTGAMQPGPVTATAISLGARNRHAGALLAVGHGIVEFPLMILIIVGLGKFFQWDATKISIGLAGGSILLIMGIQIFRSSARTGDVEAAPKKATPVVAGIVLTLSNPYFLIWWATVGLALALEAVDFGIWAFALFAVVHWFVDLIWVEALSLASFHGTTLLGPRLEHAVLRVCGAALLGFGAFFIYRAIDMLVALKGAQ
jgi:threonine/homoserine/homoserine lactone efflux protein